MSDEYWDQAPYSMIGVATTIQGRTRKQANPIGFIWPKREKRSPVKQPKARKK